MGYFNTSSINFPERIAHALSRLGTVLKQESWSAWASLGITATQRAILLRLGETATSQTLGEIARHIGISAPTASDAVATLTQKGWVKKEPSQHDLRSILISLTETGQSRLSELSEVHDALSQAVTHLSPDDQTDFYRISLNLIWELQQNGVIPKSRSCLRCRYFDPNSFPGEPPSHYCHFARESFQTHQLRMECPDHVAAESNYQIVLFRRFNQPKADKTPIAEEAPPTA